MLRFLRSRALPTLAPLKSHVLFSTKSAPQLPERARIALVGRTNVGKSTLFNRLTKSRGAIVHNVPGTTRDRRFAVGYLAGLEFDVIDTGGLADAPTGSLERGMLDQTERALHEADLILFLIDGREGVTEIDKHFARWLRKADPQSPIQLVANKLEGDATQWLGNIHDSYQLGMGEPLVISAEHGEGLTDLVPLLEPLVQGHAAAVAAEKAALASELSSDDEGFNDSFDSPRSIKLAIVGRPNVGKSTLLNKIVRDNRVLTGPEPGVTRDAVEVKWEFQGREITLVDTAGIRRFSKRDHSNQIENLSVRDTYDAISSAQVVCVVVDVSEEHLIHLDLTIAQRVLDEGRALVLVANKADLVGDAEAEIERIRKELDGSLAQVRGVPIVSISALKGKGIRNILPEVVAAHNRWDLRVTTGRLNRWMAAMDRHHPPPTVKGKTLKVKYITQVKARPPTFALFVNKAEDVPESYRRFLLNQLRTEFDMIGVPARLLLRGSEDNPYKRGYSRAKPTSRRPAVAKPVPFGGRNASPKAASPTRPVAIAAIPAAKTPSKKANVVRGTHKHKIRSLSPGAKPSNSKGRAARREPAKKPSGRGGRDAPTSRPSKKSGGGGMQKGKSSRRHKTDRTTLRDPSAKKASRWSAKKKESIKRHNGTRKPRTG
ncbi:ribosome-associated GTPase EngA, variant 1 [Aphanomyces invadans]|uniref:GTPase Der n=1 Tax=Aphanomyces invadans TaxID=157072 RepID=A0A024USL1_9STRA|nr:ribosome-associated GTPase EngA, variant 1 [Aphanomyces invadans]ETW08915.1 ribosome-associated GTPase EngA, variant 1 [Aphanomyces invadans]|eukprot:XP_008862721.1 ribosome-associated GTPase EngA, variant 1 [Aphanomyces invadans]